MHSRDFFCLYNFEHYACCCKFQIVISGADDRYDDMVDMMDESEM